MRLKLKLKLETEPKRLLAARALQPRYGKMLYEVITEESYNDMKKQIENKGFTINNIDATVILEKPKLGNYIPSIKKKLSGITNLNASQISIKATTTDKLGFIGRESGWAVLAIATITDNNE